MEKARREHIAFKLSNSVYVAGGVNETSTVLSCCERYEIKEKKWFSSSYTLPYPLCGAMTSQSKDDSFALVVGGYAGNGKYSKAIITFSEKEGFKTLSDLSLDTGMEGGVCISI